MTGYFQKATNKTVVNSATANSDIQWGFDLVCGDATLATHEAGGWALPGGGRIIKAAEAREAVIAMGAIAKSLEK